MDIHDVIIQASVVTLGLLAAYFIKLVIDFVADLICGKDE